MISSLLAQWLLAVIFACCDLPCSEVLILTFALTGAS